MLPVLPTTKPHHVHLDNNNSQRSTTKRSPSMIFRIEHLVPSASTPEVSLSLRNRATQATTEDPASKRSRLVRSGVFAAQFTPKDSVSETIDTMSLVSAALEEDARVHHFQMTEFQQQQLQQSHMRNHAYCSLTNGRLTMPAPMMRKMKLSEDIHSYNAVFELHNGGVRVRIVRDLVRDEELIAWFGEEITLLMSIPFLTPLNIQGNDRYTCHLCHLTFETPNPLKVHLALGCGRHSMDILWIRLHYAIKATHYTQQLMPQAPSSAILVTPTSAQLSPFRATSTASSASPSHSPHRHSPPHAQRFSAFKPISPSTSMAPSTPTSLLSGLSGLHAATTITTTAAIVPSASTATNVGNSFLPAISSANLSTINMLQPPITNPLNAAAQIEAIVSNMGASKQGHLCIYCGKVYSRKYGLKIHIRTHTGFKPLKCKYCLRPFGDPSNLNKHVRLHLQTNTANVPSSYEGFKCHLCHKTLARRRDLQRHIESRHSRTQMAANEEQQLQSPHPTTDEPSSEQDISP